MDYGVLLTSRLRAVASTPEPLGAMLLRKMRVETVNEFVDRMLDVLRKGDEEGHPFHGNQYVLVRAVVARKSKGERQQGEEQGREVQPPRRRQGACARAAHVRQAVQHIKELAQATGAKEERVKFLISRLQNPKYAPAGKVALTLEKQPDGKYKLAGTKEAAPKEPRRSRSQSVHRSRRALRSPRPTRRRPARNRTLSVLR
jgi:hypothetical protein